MFEMLHKDNSDMNTLASNAIHSCLQDGYRIDAKESVIDANKDKDCTFKAVLKRDVDGIECKTIIKVSETGSSDKNKSYSYNKVEYVGDTKWSEESRTYSSSTSVYSHVNEKESNKAKHTCKDSNSKYECKYPSAFTRLDDVIKINNKEQGDSTKHIKVNSDDSEEDIYNKIVNKEEPKKEDAHEDDIDELEDSLITLVRYLFNM